MTNVVIIGGGISGLSTAFYLRQLDSSIRMTVLEAGDRPGGVIQTVHRDGFMIENAADNFITTTSDAIDLCQQVGLADNLIRTNPIGRQAMVVRRGKLLPIPPGFIIMAPSRVWPMITTQTLSLLGKIRAGCELFIPRRKSLSDESLKSFVVRRFGQEMFDRLVQPLVGGIYTADPRLLSLAATMPRFVEMERQQGSLIRAAYRQRHTGQRAESGAGARYGQFMTLQGGLSKLTQALVEQLPARSVRMDSQVVSMQPRAKGGWKIRVTGSEPDWLEADAVVLATPAHESARLTSNIDAFLAEDLSTIPYASCAVVALGYEVSQIGVPLDSFGFVVPLAEGRMILSCSFSSVKYTGRASEGRVLLRVFVGGACQSGLLRLPEEELVQLAERELAELMKIRGQPVLRHIKTHWQSMPQYHVGHLERVASIESRLKRFPDLVLAGSSLYGVGIPNCICSGRKAAEKIFCRINNSSDVAVTS